MLSLEANDRVTRVSAGTPAGELFRRYWLPIHPTEHLVDRPVIPIRILGEDLVLYRDRSGALGLIDDKCPHRKTSLTLGIPEEKGLRCCYHGWLFDELGNCLEMPLEPADATFKNKICIKAYPVHDMGGLIWAYLGPKPAPELPRWDIYVRPGGFKQMIGHHIPTNWLQVVENQADPGHIPYGHGRFFQYALETEGKLTSDPRTFYNASYANSRAVQSRGLHPLFRAISNEFGYTVGRRLSNEGEDVSSWNVGSGPMLFPTTLTSGPGDIGLQIRRWCQVVVPIDDYNTWQIQYFSYFFPEDVDVPQQGSVPYTEVPLRTPEGRDILDYALGQDIAIFQGQGRMADRAKERLGVNDAIVIAYRKLLSEQIDVVASGRDPINVFRSIAAAQSPDLRIPGAETGLPPRGLKGRVSENFHVCPKGGRPLIDDVVDRYNRDRDLIIEMYAKTEAIVQKAGA